MTLVDFVIACLEGLDLERFDLLVPFITSFIIILIAGLSVRALMGIFDIFFSKSKKGW